MIDKISTLMCEHGLDYDTNKEFIKELLNLLDCDENGDKICRHPTHLQSYDNVTGIQKCECGEITN